MNGEHCNDGQVLGHAASFLKSGAPGVCAHLRLNIGTHVCRKSLSCMSCQKCTKPCIMTHHETSGSRNERTLHSPTIPPALLPMACLRPVPTRRKRAMCKAVNAFVPLPLTSFGESGCLTPRTPQACTRRKGGRMKISKLLAIPLPIAVAASPLAARQVDLLQFGAEVTISQEPGKQASDISSGARAGSQAVSASLRQHFDKDSPWPAKTDGSPSRLAAAAWSNPQVPAMALARPAAGPSDGSCDGAIYTPTWWLAREAEMRRRTFFGTVAQIACEHRLPTRLLDAMIAQESGYNSWAISSAGAMGMLQIMPNTARRLGLARPFDPVANVRAGARYLREQLDRFGRVDLALAAYNAGPERRSLQRGAIPRIPETITYVRIITTNWARLAALEQGATRSRKRGQAALAGVNASHDRSVERIGFD